jgi:hypothetical protein
MTRAAEHKRPSLERPGHLADDDERVNEAVSALSDS